MIVRLTKRLTYTTMRYPSAARIPHWNAGAKDGGRSRDLVFFRHALYQLSYLGTLNCLVGDDGLEPPTPSV
jgi:hypothetical protein